MGKNKKLGDKGRKETTGVIKNFKKKTCIAYSSIGLKPHPPLRKGALVESIKIRPESAKRDALRRPVEQSADGHQGEASRSLHL